MSSVLSAAGEAAAALLTSQGVRARARVCARGGGSRHGRAEKQPPGATLLPACGLDLSPPAPFLAPPPSPLEEPPVPGGAD